MGNRGVFLASVLWGASCDCYRAGGCWLVEGGFLLWPNTTLRHSHNINKMRSLGLIKADRIRMESSKVWSSGTERWPTCRLGYRADSFSNQETSEMKQKENSLLRRTESSSPAQLSNDPYDTYSVVSTDQLKCLKSTVGLVSKGTPENHHHHHHHHVSQPTAWTIRFSLKCGSDKDWGWNYTLRVFFFF